MSKDIRWPGQMGSLAAYDYLDAIETYGSMARAAGRFDVNPAAVSAAIGKLEDLLGRSWDKKAKIKLIERTPGGTALTEQGTLVAAWYRRTKDQARDLDAGVHAVPPPGGATRPAEQLRVAASTTTSESLVPRWLKTLVTMHPDLRPVLESTRSREVINRVKHDYADVGFIADASTPEGLENTEDEIEQRAVGEDELVLVVPRKHHWAKKELISRDELFDEPQVARAEGAGSLSRFREILTEDFGPDRPDIAIVLRCNSSVALLAAAVEHLRPAVVSSVAVRDRLASGDLVKVRADGLRRWMRRERRAIWQKSKKDDTYIRDLVDAAAADSASWTFDSELREVLDYVGRVESVPELGEVLDRVDKVGGARAFLSWFDANYKPATSAGADEEPAPEGSAR